MTSPDIRRLSAAPLWRFGLIVLLNLIPVGGVLWLGWDAAQILMLYWIENVIIGVMSLARILTAADRLPSAPNQKPENRFGVGCFFIVHYGGFTLAHGVMTVMLAGRILGDAGLLWDRVFANATFHWAVLAAAILQLAIMIREWWLSGLWRRSTPFMEMFRPYGRIVVLHVTVLAGAWALSELSAPAWAVLALCLMKAVVELVVTALVRPEPPAR